MNRRYWLIVLIVLASTLLLALTPLAAQVDEQVCEGIIADALAKTTEFCGGTGRNQACYGNLEVDAEPQPQITDFVFAARGDIEDLDRISTMSLSQLDTASGAWGVVRLEVQADIDPEQLTSNVTMLMFGRVSVQYAGMKEIGALSRPLQAFVVETGVDDAPCFAAPQSGMLIQTPEGVAEINLLINEVHISLGSTAFIQAQPNGAMSVNLLEGSAHVRARSGEVTLVPGTQSVVALDEFGRASAPPTEAQPYPMTLAETLPLHNLPRAFEPVVAVAAAPSEAPELTAALTVIQGPVDSISGNMISIYGLPIRVDAGHPLLPVLRAGDVVRVEGERVIENGLPVVVAISLTFVDIDVEISDTGDIWRDTGDCTVVPPDWADAPLWTQRCVPAAPPPNGGGSGGGSGSQGNGNSGGGSGSPGNSGNPQGGNGNGGGNGGCPWWWCGGGDDDDRGRGRDDD